MISANHWIVGDVLMCRETGARCDISIADISQHPVEGRLDGLDGWPGNLHVEHVGFCGHLSVLETVNKFVAQRFDLPTRRVRVSYGDLTKGLLQGHVERADDGYVVLLPANPVHFSIPRACWLQYRLQDQLKRERESIPQGAARLGFPSTLEARNG